MIERTGAAHIKTDDGFSPQLIRTSVEFLIDPEADQDHSQLHGSR
jgi:hypothetical protein